MLLTGYAPGRIPQSAFTSWRGRAAARQRCGVPHAPTVCVCYSSRQRRVPWSPEVCVFLKLRGPDPGNDDEAPLAMPYVAVWHVNPEQKQCRCHVCQRST